MKKKRKKILNLLKETVMYLHLEYMFFSPKFSDNFISETVYHCKTISMFIFYLVGNNISVGLVSREQCWSYKSQTRVFHATEWKGGRQHQNIVLSPNIGSTQILENVGMTQQHLNCDIFHKLQRKCSLSKKVISHNCSR